MGLRVEYPCGCVREAGAMCYCPTHAQIREAEAAASAPLWYFIVVVLLTVWAIVMVLE